jgi:hypothetical protein
MRERPVPWFNASVFLGARVRLDFGFSAARARLANLARGELLGRASEEAYGELEAMLARARPPGATPGMSRLAAVRVSEMTAHDDFAVAPMRWEVIGPTGTLFPALDADIMLTPAGQDATVLSVSGVYRPPPGSLGAGLDRVIVHRVAEATIRAFTHQIGTAIAHPAVVPQAGHVGLLPEPAPGPEPELP